MAKPINGSCLCGKVTFSVTGFDEKVAHCHCSMCRKFHGAAFGTLSGVVGLKWHSGEDLLKHFVADNGTTRTFCGNCGSSIGFRAQGADLSAIELALALFDDDIQVNIDTHIYTRFKSNWYHITDDLAQMPKGRK